MQSQSYLGKIMILRVTSVFSEDLESRIFGRIVTKIMKKEKLIFSGTGDEVRDFIQIKDLVQAVLCVLKSQSESLIEVYNVGSGNLTSVRELVHIALSAYAKLDNNDFDKHVTFDGTIRPWDPRVISINTRRIQSKGFIPSFSSKSDLESYFMKAFSKNE
jgi:nucleoside-diphosphate-sugar epimerase